MRSFLNPIGLLCLLLSLNAKAEIRLLSDSNDATELEFVTPKWVRRTVLRAGKHFTEIGMPGTESLTKSGFPEVPYVKVRILVPPDSDWTLEYKEPMRGKPIRLKYPVSYGERLPLHDGEIHLASKDAKAYSRTHGDEAVRVEEEGFAASDRLLVLKLWPLRYDARKQTLQTRRKIHVRITYQPSQRKLSAPLRHSRSSVSRYVVINPKAPSDEDRDSNLKTDLIIAHSTFGADLFPLIEFKISRGRKVRYFFVENKTATEIKQLIKREYDAAEPPSQTLLIGNPALIPNFRGSSDNTWTDFDYQLLGTDLIPDIALGRIPAANSTELRAAVDKVLAREIEPRDVTQVLLTAGRDTSLGCPQSVSQVGVKIKANAADVQIVKKFRTEVSTEDVYDAYNANPNLIVYDGHGNREGMQEIPLTLSSLSKLTNQSFPIILDIACLNGNWSSSANWINFTSGILFQPGRGAAGILSSGGSGYGHDFFQNLGEIMGEARKNLSSDSKMNEIAQVVLAAKILGNSQDRSFWNYYGDPASSVWESPR